MNSEDPPLQHLFLSWRLAFLAYVLFGLFVIQVLAAIVPVRLIDPAWQLSLISSLLAIAYLPLLGLGLLHLASGLSDWDERLRRQLRWAARLALPVCLGFLLLIPLQWAALGQLNSKADGQRQRELSRLETLVTSLRQVVRQSGSTTEIFSRLRSLSAPPPPAAYQSMPLPVLRERMKRDLLDAEQQLNLRRADAARSRFWKVVPLASRNTLLLLSFCLGFAGLAQRRGRELPLLLETFDRLQRLQQRAPRSLRTGSQAERQNLARYVEELSRE